jgi:23S rRNA (adenine1618-N6)-methyltransferase
VKTKKKHPATKSKLHPKSKHRERYDFKALIKTLPELSSFVSKNEYGDESINFFDPKAVKTLNTALLIHFYDISYWNIPDSYLCPPIPGRADYIHHIAQLLGESNYGNIPTGQHIKCLDVGVGANCIYPIIGTQEYDWSFIGVDIDKVAIDNAKEIVNKNKNLKGKIEFRNQQNPKDVFYGILPKEEQVDLTICNPPFHASEKEANASTQRKVKNLKGKLDADPIKNFGGQNAELWCDGGENRFVRNMVKESKKFANNCFWFSTLISKQTNLKSVYNALENESAVEVKTIEMGQGNKSSRIVAWTFLSLEEQKNWRDSKWKK